MTQPDDLVLDDKLDPDERDLEAPDADAAEQAQEVRPAGGRSEVSRSIEAPSWDAQEQAQVVDLDDDDYR